MHLWRRSRLVCLDLFLDLGPTALEQSHGRPQSHGRETSE